MQRDLGTTTVYVTHDQVEAMTMGDRVAVMDAGVLQQAASPREIYDRPANTFVAKFIGSPTMSLFTCPVEKGIAWLGGSKVPCPAEGAHFVTVGVRAEDWTIVGAGATTGTEGLDLNVVHVEELGAESFLYCTPVDPAVEASSQVAVRAPRGENIGPDTRLCVRPTFTHFFDVATGLRIE